MCGCFFHCVVISLLKKQKKNRCLVGKMFEILVSVANDSDSGGGGGEGDTLGSNKMFG